jgi:hypothetical protein
MIRDKGLDERQVSGRWFVEGKREGVMKPPYSPIPQRQSLPRPVDVRFPRRYLVARAVKYGAGDFD